MRRLYIKLNTITVILCYTNATDETGMALARAIEQNSALQTVMIMLLLGTRIGARFTLYIIITMGSTLCCVAEPVRRFT